MIFHYGENTIERTDCPSGNNQICEFNVDLTPYNGQTITYFFELQDIAGNTDESQENDIDIDLTNPTAITLTYDVQNDDVNFFIEVSENNVKVTYNDNGGSFKTLCSDADLDDPCETDKSFDEGVHDLIIKLEDDAGLTSEYPITVFIDSEPPEFDELLPKSNNYAFGEFSTEITENLELTNTKLFYGLENNMKMFDLGNACATGENVLCTANVDLTEFDGTEDLQYYFEASDTVNTEQSKTTKNINVDLTPPVPTSLTFDIDEDKVDFTIEVSENDVKITYSDNGANFKTLCSDADLDDPCEKKKTFDEGFHEVTLKFEDDGELATESIVTFTI